MSGIKVLHTGDFHLGYDYGKIEIHNEERIQEQKETFQNILQLCRRKQVDVMLLAGDLFDNDNPSDELVRFVIGQFQMLEDTIVMIAPGNHDYYRPNAFYDQITSACENVFVFDGEMDFYEFHIREHTVRIYGAGFTDSIQKESLMKQRKLFRDVAITLGVFHGDIGNENADSKYAPMSLKQIAANEFDYLALGHIHKQTEILHAGRTAYAYCGCPEGLNFGTQGEKGVYIGEVGVGYADMEYVWTCKRMYLEEVFAGFDRQTKLSEHIKNRLRASYGVDYRKHFYRIVLKSISEQDIDMTRLREELEDIYSVEILCEKVQTQAEKKKPILKRQGEHRFLINRIHIVRFGGLQNFSMDFEDGFQMIYGKNEFGKSTILAFIRMMLYGCSSKARNILQNPRKKYQPLDGSTMQGSMEFWINGISYTLEREFGKQKSYDRLRIFETESGRELIFSKEYEVGEYFLGISAEDFDRTVFAGNDIGTNEMGAKSVLLTRIANLTGGISEERDLPLELKEMEKNIELLRSKRGTNGKIPEIDGQIDEYRKEISRLKEEKREFCESESLQADSMKREKKVIKELIAKLDKLERTADYSEEKRFKRLMKKKKFLTNSMVAVILVIGIVFLGFKDSLTIPLLGAIGVAGVILLIALASEWLKTAQNIKECVPYNEDLQERIDVIREEFGYEGYSKEELEEKLEEIEERLSNASTRGVEKLQRRITEYEDKIVRLRDKKRSYEKELDALQEQANQLKELMQQAGKQIATPVHERAVELFSRMSGNEYESFIVDEDFNVKVKKYGQGMYVDWQYFSTATAIQAYLSLRIALCESFGNEGIVLPLLFDDVLSYLDEERVYDTIRILKELETQVILFTCHRWMCKFE